MVEKIEEIFAKNNIDFMQIKTSEGLDFIDSVIKLESALSKKWLMKKINTSEKIAFDGNEISEKDSLLLQKLIRLEPAKSIIPTNISNAFKENEKLSHDL